MSIAQVGSVSTSIVSGGRISATYSHIVGAGADRILIVIVNLTSNAQSVSGVTFGGVALTNALVAGEDFRPALEVWYLLNPAVSTADVVVTLTGSLGSWGTGAINYTGVNQTTPIGATASAAFNSGAGQDATVVIVTTMNNSMIVGGITTRQAGTLATPGTGTTERYDGDTGAAVGDVLCVGGDQITTTSGSHTFNFTFVADDRAAVGCVELIEDGADPTKSVFGNFVENDPVFGRGSFVTG